MRHSLWEQGSLEACNERLFGYLDSEVEALQQRKAVYDAERRLSEGSDSCWSGAYSDSDSAAELEVNTEPIQLQWKVLWWLLYRGGGRGCSRRASWQEEEEAQAGSAASEAFTLGTGLAGGPE